MSAKIVAPCMYPNGCKALFSIGTFPKFMQCFFRGKAINICPILERVVLVYLRVAFLV